MPAHPTTTVPAPLDKLVQRRVKVLARYLPHALEGVSEAIHEARVASRRVSEALPIVSSELDRQVARKAKRGLQRVRRVLGPVRDLDVSLLALDEFAQHGRAPAEAAALVRHHMEQARADRRAVMCHVLRGARIKRLITRLGAVVDQLRPDSESASASWVPRLSARLGTCAQRLRDAIEEAGALYVPERLHAIRIVGKKLRYALEFTDETRLVSTRRLITTLKGAQDHLGRFHDLAILMRAVNETEAALGARVARRLGMNDLKKLLDTECRACHAHYVRHHAELIHLADTVTDRFVPQLNDRAMAPRTHELV